MLRFTEPAGDLPTPSYNFFEVFAGGAEVSGVWKQAGFTTASYDREYMSGRGMDFNSAPGFLPLVVDYARTRRGRNNFLVTDQFLKLFLPLVE